MNEIRALRLTPWVTRLIAINGVILLLLSTVFTDPRFFNALMFDPSSFIDRPWTAVTYMFVPGGLAPLVVSSLVLALFGPPVERRLGGRQFGAYYLYCGVGAALLALGLGTFLRVDPFVGASGPAYGVGLAFVLFWPKTRVAIAPLATPFTALTLFAGLAGIDLILGILGRDGIAHLVHLGGAVAGYAFFRLQSIGNRRQPAKPVPTARRAVVTPMRVQEMGGDFRPAVAVGNPTNSTDDDVDLLLDKISRFGMESLTSQERKLLREASERKRREQH